MSDEVVRRVPDPRRGTSAREPPLSASPPPVIPYQASPAPPSSSGHTIVPVPDPHRATSVPWSGPFKPFVIPTFLSWEPVYVQPSRVILRATGTDLARHSGELVFADRFLPTLVQPNRPIIRVAGTDLVRPLGELIFADKWEPTWVQPSRAVRNLAVSSLVGHDIMPFDLLVPLSQPTVSITGNISLSSTAFGRMHICTGTSANYTVILPSPTGNSGDFIGFIMGSGLTKLVTIAQNASEKIDGANSRAMWANEVAVLYTDGTNWIKAYGKSIPMTCTMYQGSGGVTLTYGNFTVVPMNTMQVDNTGLMADTTNGRINIVRTGTYNFEGIISAGVPGVSTPFQVYITWNSTANSQSSSNYYVSSSQGVNVTCLALGTATAGTYVNIECYNAGTTSSSNVSTSSIYAPGLNNVSATEIITW
jgi:hypothetical protein